jgi:hypothetical protein
MNPNKKTYEQNVGIYDNDITPLYKRELNKIKFEKLLETFR